MKSGKGHQEEEEEEEDEYGSKKDATSSANNSKGKHTLTHNRFLCIRTLQISISFFSFDFVLFRILKVGVAKWELGAGMEFFVIFLFDWVFVETDGKSSDKANAIRSKHSVTEQRRRSKINER